MVTPVPSSRLRQSQDVDEEDEDGVKPRRVHGAFRRPGDRWMFRGPIEYVPPATVEVVLRRQAIPLDENEGIYVRDIKTGKVGPSVFMWLRSIPAASQSPGATPTKWLHTSDCECGQRRP